MFGGQSGPEEPEFPLKPSLDGRSMLGLGANTFLKMRYPAPKGEAAHLIGRRN
jgi:hypothetical protein